MVFFISKGNRNITVCHIQIHHSSRKSSQFTHGTGKCCTGLWFGPGKPRAKSYFSGGLCCIFFGVMYPLSFFFFRWWGGIVFFRENMGGYTMFEIFSEIVWYSYLVVVCVVVVYNIFLARCPTCGASVASSFLLMHFSIITAQQNWVGVALN